MDQSDFQNKTYFFVTTRKDNTLKGEVTDHQEGATNEHLGRSYWIGAIVIIGTHQPYHVRLPLNIRIYAKKNLE